MKNTLYLAKTPEYFTRARTEIESLLPAADNGSFRVLEIGCAEGHTLSWLKKIGYCNWAIGVEPYSKLGVETGVVDQFFQMDIERTIPPIPPHSIDVILCLDVLEHLVNPWEVLIKLNPILKPSGSWIISVPNLRNYRILFNLAFKGHFRYTESGILDKTHLRFFTRESAILLAQSSGAQVTKIHRSEMNRWFKIFLSMIGLGDLVTKQFILCAKKLS
jgi:2-polyprenyl-3-methyl-5-hydroxy-6-metoxy-1,4-benzoquinol methylase